MLLLCPRCEAARDELGFRDPEKASFRPLPILGLEARALSRAPMLFWPRWL